jgi:asparagine synthetase B (glutamine-hydrolysing)
VNRWLLQISWLCNSADSTPEFVASHLEFSNKSTLLWTYAKVEIYSDTLHLEASDQYSHKKPNAFTFLSGQLNHGFSTENHFPEGSFSLLKIDSQNEKIRILTDHLGSHPVFICESSSGVSYSNSLQAIYLQSKTTPQIDEEQIGVFLLTNMVTRMDRNRTPFKNIQRLESAQEIIIESPKIKSHTYWQIEDESCCTQKKSIGELSEQFEFTLSQCIADRISQFPNNQCSLALSGGLDSGLIAAIASNQGANFKAFTISHNSIHPNDEWSLAKSVSERYGFPHERIIADEIPYYQPSQWDIDLMRGSVISSSAVLAEQMNGHSQYGLNGLSGDNILAKGFPNLASPSSWQRIAYDLVHEHKRPLLGLKRFLPDNFIQLKNAADNIPNWIQPEFATTIQIESKNQELENLKHRNYHPTHNLLAMSLKRYDWTERYAERLNYQVFDPYFDIRMVRFSLSLDPFAHLSGKRLQRELAKKLLPEAIVKRPKTILGDTNTSTLRVASPELVDLWEAHPDLGKYIQRDLVPHIAGAKLPPRELFNASKAFWLNSWLVGLSEFNKKRLP